jgi:excisionase family DNA binding protein
MSTPTRDRINRDRLLTLTAVAGVLQVSIRTLKRMLRTKKLPALKVGSQWRIRESQLQQWIEYRESSVTDEDSTKD